jgi:hypothetical protein
MSLDSRLRAARHEYRRIDHDLAVDRPFMAGRRSVARGPWTLSVAALVLLALVVSMLVWRSRDGSDDGNVHVDTGETTTVVPAFDLQQLDGMVLHLPDGPAGARIGDDSGCGDGLSTEGRTDAFIDLVLEDGGEVVWCFDQLEAPDVSVESLVVSFPSEDLAIRAMDPGAFTGIARYYGLDCCNSDPIGSFVETDEPGEDALEATSDSDTTALIGWRSGALVGVVSVQRLDGASGALTEAHRLAAVQDGRMRSPVAVPVGADDDRLVGLESAPFRTWWLGETFAPPGLPPMELVATNSVDGLAEVDYGGIRIETFALDEIEEGSTQAQILGVAEELFDSPCTVTVPLEYPGGDAALLGRFVPDLASGSSAPLRSGWGALLDDVCPDGDPNVWMATVRHPNGTLVRINAPICYSCLLSPDPARPYQQPDGLRAVVDGLLPYEG